jgi:hypothetical protein
MLDYTNELLTPICSLPCEAPVGKPSNFFSLYHIKFGKGWIHLPFVSFQAFMVGSAKNDLLGYYATQNSLKVCSKIPSEYQKIPMTLYGVIFHEAII